MHFDFVCCACKNGRATAGAEMSPGIVLRFAGNRHGILRKHSGGVEEGTVMLSAVEAMA
jgi:hypothetical protein